MHVDRKQKTVPENNTIYLTLKDSRAFSPRQPWPKILSKVMKKNVKKQHWVKVKGGIEKVWTYNKHVTMIIVPLTRSVNKQKTLVRLQIVHSSYGLCLRMINQITITGYSFASSDRSRSLRKFATDRSGCRFHHFEIRCHRSLWLHAHSTAAADDHIKAYSPSAWLKEQNGRTTRGRWGAYMSS